MRTQGVRLVKFVVLASEGIGGGYSRLLFSILGFNLLGKLVDDFAVFTITPGNVSSFELMYTPLSVPIKSPVTDNQEEDDVFTQKKEEDDEEKDDDGDGNEEGEDGGGATVKKWIMYAARFKFLAVEKIRVSRPSWKW